MKSSTLLKTGIIGSAIAALCCFTPALVILLGAIGLSAWVGYLDAILMPALIGFFLLVVYAFLKKDKHNTCSIDSEET